MSVRNGITDGTKMCGLERVGNCFALLCAMHTQLGKNLLAREMAARGIFWRKFTNCLKLYLSYERWVTEAHSRSSIQKSTLLLGDLITMIKDCFPREDGWGWNLPKMHAYAKIPQNMLKFGSAGNFSGQIGERALKGIVKDHAARTQKRPGSFAEQCAIREYERNVLKYVMTDLENQLGVRSLGQKQHSTKKEFRGRFILSLSKTNNRGVGVSDDKVAWHDKKKNKMNGFHSGSFYIRNMKIWTSTRIQ